MLEVSNLINDRGNAAANQFVIRDGKKTVFQSYRSRIACKKNGYGGTVTIVPEAVQPIGTTLQSSQTTRKHLYIFLRDHCGQSIYNIDELRRAIKNGYIKVGRF
jgi:hypothetical protein